MWRIEVYRLRLWTLDYQESAYFNTARVSFPSRKQNDQPSPTSWKDISKRKLEGKLSEKTILSFFVHCRGDLYKPVEAWRTRPAISAADGKAEGALTRVLWIGIQENCTTTGPCMFYSESESSKGAHVLPQ